MHGTEYGGVVFANRENDYTMLILAPFVTIPEIQFCLDYGEHYNSWGWR
jgi:hypothetical protein